jgi:2-oxoglutarate dehydrogenase E1 component
VVASGKVAVEASTAREQLAAPVAVVRVEQLYPWPTEALAAEVSRFTNCAEIVWLQEEPENMGPWNAIKGHLYQRFDDRYRIARVSRADEGSPATGSHGIHVQEQDDLLRRALAPLG